VQDGIHSQLQPFFLIGQGQHDTEAQAILCKSARLWADAMSPRDGYEDNNKGANLRSEQESSHVHDRSDQGCSQRQLKERTLILSNSDQLLLSG